MTPSDPPRVPLALLRRFLRDNEPLAGDLLETFARNQSGLWFWRQVLTAIVIQAFHREYEAPLGLAAYLGSHSHEPVRREDEWRHVDLSASPVPGIGGLGLVALGCIVALARPEVWGLFVPAIIGGAALGLTMTLVRRHAILSGPILSSRLLLQDRDDAPARPQQRPM